jgi:hypothetical protein
MRKPKPSDGLPSDACAFIATHDTPVSDDLDPTLSNVTEYYWKFGEWKTCVRPVPFVEFVDGMIDEMKPLVFPF